MFEIIPSPRPVGAEVRGLDLSEPLDAATVARVRDTLSKHGVIYFRNQQLTPTRQVAYLEQFGTMQPYDPKAPFRLEEARDVLVLSNAYEQGKPVGIIEAGQYWHSDLSYRPDPPLYAGLFAVEVPHDDAGRSLGGTMFVGTAHAYDTLSPQLKARVEGRTALHDRDKRRFSATRRTQPNEFDGASQTQAQPMVRVHPVTGRRGLYVNQTYTAAITGMDPEESDALLEALYQHLYRQEVRFTHQWQVGDLLMWDDCAVQHHAINDYQLPQRRLIHRAVLEGSKPFGVTRAEPVQA